MQWMGVMVVGLVVTAPLRAQGHATHDMAMPDPHMRMTDLRPIASGDQARADSILLLARAATEKYRDLALAEADGFRRFAPDVPHQRIYHYTRFGAAVKARFSFDPSQPSSLLYRDDGAGGMKLVGVMYTAPAGATPEELDARVPLSIGQWHLHTNICLPPKRAGRETVNSEGARFGFRGTVVTKAACEAEGGRFFESMFGWMLHVNLYDPGPSGPWRDDHGGMRPH